MKWVTSLNNQTLHGSWSIAIALSPINLFKSFPSIEIVDGSLHTLQKQHGKWLVFIFVKNLFVYLIPFSLMLTHDVNIIKDHMKRKWCWFRVVHSPIIFITMRGCRMRTISDNDIANWLSLSTPRFPNNIIQLCPSIVETKFEKHIGGGSHWLNEWSSSPVGSTSILH